MVNFKCDCGNILTVQSIAVKLGLVTDCGHCYKYYPREQHEQAIQEAVNNFTEEELYEMSRDIQ